MARRAPAVLALLTCASVAGALPTLTGAEGEGVRLGVIVCDAARVPPRTLGTAQREASRVLAKAGIEVEWRACSRDLVAGVKDVEGDAACHRPVLPDEVVLEILPQATSGARREVAGFAWVSSDGREPECAAVFFEAAHHLSRLGDASAPQVLAHLIAHEIGHLLLGAGSHSPGGVMRAAWSRRDVVRAGLGQLTFEPEQLEKLRAGALARRARNTTPSESWLQPGRGHSEVCHEPVGASALSCIRPQSWDPASYREGGDVAGSSCWRRSTIPPRSSTTWPSSPW